MIQQIQNEEEDDDVSDNDTVDENGSDINVGTNNSEDQSSLDQPRDVLGSAVEWRVVSVKPGGVKVADHSQYVDWYAHVYSFCVFLMVLLSDSVGEGVVFLGSPNVPYICVCWSIRPVRYCYHDISQTASTVSIKLARNID